MQHEEVADVLHDHLTPEELVPAVGPDRGRDDQGDDPERHDARADASGGGADELEDEANPDRRQGRDGEVFDPEGEQLRVEIAAGNFPGVRQAPERDRDEEEAVPARAADAVAGERVPRDGDEERGPAEKCQKPRRQRQGPAFP